MKETQGQEKQRLNGRDGEKAKTAQLLAPSTRILSHTCSLPQSPFFSRNSVMTLKAPVAFRWKLMWWLAPGCTLTCNGFAFA